MTFIQLNSKTRDVIDLDKLICFNPVGQVIIRFQVPGSQLDIMYNTETDRNNDLKMLTTFLVRK
jgi:hypothetical protein